MMNLEGSIELYRNVSSGKISYNSSNNLLNVSIFD